MKRYYLLLLLIVTIVFLIPPTLVSAQGSPMTIKEAVLKALKVHPTIKAEKMAYQAQIQATKNAHAPLLPSIDLSADSGYERVHNSSTRTRKTTGRDSDDYRDLWYNTQSLSLTQLLYDGWMSRSKYEAQTHRTQSNKILVSGMADEIALKTIESYMDILRARKTIHLAQENIKALKELRKKTRLRLESGKGTITDVDRIQLTLSDAKVMLINYQGILKYAQDRFKSLTQADSNLITRQLTIKFDTKITTVEASIDQAMKDNKALMVARSNIQQKEADLKASKGLYHPKVNLIFEGTREENIEGIEDVDYSAAGFVRVNFNLLNGGGDVAAVYQNASLLSEARYREEEIILDIDTKVRFEFNNLTTAENQIPLLNKKVKQNLKVLSNYEEQFLVGKRDIMDVIEAQKMLFTFQAALENIETEKKLAQFRLLTITGHLFETLGIDFNPES